MWKEQLSPPDALGLLPRWHLRSAPGRGAGRAPAEAAGAAVGMSMPSVLGTVWLREGALPVQHREGVFLRASWLREESHGSLPLPWAALPPSPCTPTASLPLMLTPAWPPCPVPSTLELS